MDLWINAMGFLHPQIVRSAAVRTDRPYSNTFPQSFTSLSRNHFPTTKLEHAADHLLSMVLTGKQSTYLPSESHTKPKQKENTV